MRYKIAVCDDMEEDVKYISSAVNQWAEKENIMVDIETFPSAESFLSRYAEQKAFDILLLDIEMPSMNGVELAKRIRKENDAVQIIFITGYTDYIAEGYEVSALHYLVKPLSETKLFKVLNRAVLKIRKNEKSLYLSLSGEMIRIPIYEIKYLEVQQNYVTVHSKKDYTVKKHSENSSANWTNVFTEWVVPSSSTFPASIKSLKLMFFYLTGRSFPCPEGNMNL